MSQPDLNLTPEEWEALGETLASERELDPDNYIATALDKVLAHRPKHALEDGWYRDEAGVLREVRDGKVRGAFLRDVWVDPSEYDTSGWTRLRVLADDEVAVRLGVLESLRFHVDKYPDDCYCGENIRAALAGALPHRDDEADR